MEASDIYLVMDWLSYYYTCTSTSSSHDLKKLYAPEVSESPQINEENLQAGISALGSDGATWYTFPKWLGVVTILSRNN
jgi:hypothetical protein